MDNLLPPSYDEKKAAQAAAYFLYKAGGSLPLIKLVKLLYLAERLSLKRYGEPITGDHLVSMPHGPVLSRTYDHINGALVSTEGGWTTWVSDRADYEVGLRDSSMIRSPEDDLLKLSDSDLEVLEQIWVDFGFWDKWKLVRYTHSDQCPEWIDPNGSSLPISYEQLLPKLGYTEEQTSNLIYKLSQHRYLEEAINNSKKQ